MNALNSEKTLIPRLISSVREAAEDLGVSERTIYRMLRAGKLARVKRHVRDVGNVGDNMCHNDTSKIIVTDTSMSKMSKMSDNATHDAVDMLATALRDKDAQIEQLMVNQREMNQTIQRLQEQIFELARLVLAQNTVAQAHASEPSSTQGHEKHTDWPRWLSLFRPSADKNHKK